MFQVYFNQTEQNLSHCVQDYMTNMHLNFTVENARMQSCIDSASVVYVGEMDDLCQNFTSRWSRSGRKSLKRGQFALENAREDQGTVTRDRKLQKRGGRFTSFDCIHQYLSYQKISHQSIHKYTFANLSP